MNMQRFLSYIGYTRDRPDGISPMRWRALLKHYYFSCGHPIHPDIIAS